MRHHELTFPHLPRFVSIDNLYTPTASGEQDQIYITKSYDATTHFETVAEDVADVWKRITGEDLVLDKSDVEVQS